jgi:Mn2+/Fe2+ NRAMP family transporter
MLRLPREFSFSRTLGPGLLLAGAAIGVSHLVQATRAGADYGFALWWVLLFACLTKYPFLEFGPRYSAATGENLIAGYRRLGRGPYFAFVGITVGTMFIIQAAVTIVTAGIAEQIFGLGWTPFVWSAVILAGCVALLLIGKFRALDLSMKVIISALSVGTLVAVVLAIGAGSASEVARAEVPSYWTTAGLAFLIAFAGWMPIPIDSAVWHSIWLKEKATLNNARTSVDAALIDFNVGYFIAAFLGLLFMLLGALVMFGSGTSFSPNSVVFSGQLADLYGQTIGSWSRPFVSIAALMAMVSTTLAVTDAYPRVFSYVLSNKHEEDPATAELHRTIYRTTLLVIPLGSLLILYFLTGSFALLVDFAAGLSFLSAPVLAWFNYRLVTGDGMPEEARPKKGLRLLSITCLVLLVLFAFAYLAVRLNLFT